MIVGPPETDIQGAGTEAHRTRRARRLVLGRASLYASQSLLF